MNHQPHKILALLMEYAPNAAAQELLSKQFSEDYATHYKLSDDPDLEMMKILTGTLLDGLRYGNWPWIKREHTMIPTFKSPATTVEPPARDMDIQYSMDGENYETIQTLHASRPDRTREEILELAKRDHDQLSNHKCDPKYLTSCPKYQIAILANGGARNKTS